MISYSTVKGRLKPPNLTIDYRHNMPICQAKSKIKREEREDGKREEGNKKQPLGPIISQGIPTVGDKVKLETPRIPHSRN